MSKKNHSLIEDYLQLQEKYEKIYGKNNTIVLMQVGAFHETYSTNTRGFNLHKLSDILSNVTVTKKNKNIQEVSEKNPYLLGFPSVTLNKYLKILIENDFTVIIVDQLLQEKNADREITGIYSKGTYIDDIANTDSNNILSIYIEEIKQLGMQKRLLCIGLSVIDLTIGTSTIYEVYSNITDEKYALDETIRFMNTYQPKEVIINTNNLIENNIEKVINYLDLNKLQYYLDISDITKLNKLSYQEEVLKNIFKTKGKLSCIESLDLDKYIYSRVSFVSLLNFAYEHSHVIVNCLKKPTVYEPVKYMHLGNNAMYQLNVLDDDPYNYSNRYNKGINIRSVYDIVNNTSTPMGRRFLKHSLLNPIIDINIINSRYDAIETLSKNNLYVKIEKLLKNIIDIERYQRKFKLGLLNPIDFYVLHDSYKIIIDLLDIVEKQPNLSLTIKNKNTKKILQEFLKECNGTFDISNMNKYMLNDITGSIFNKGIYNDIDEIQNKIDVYETFMVDLVTKLNEYIKDDGRKKKINIKSKSKNDSSEDEQDTKTLMKLEYNERDNYHVLITKRRGDLLKKALENVNGIKINDYFTINPKKLVYKPLPKASSYKIFIDVLDENTEKLIVLRDKIKKIVKKHYIDKLIELSGKYKSLFNNLVYFVSYIDFLKSGSSTAKLYNYCKPTIIESDKSFLEAKQLRHPIVERINIDSQYIPTDVSLGKDNLDGILLFGINSVGKTTIMKAIGLSVILAQSGLYVPAIEFNYFPYKSLFTRITGIDNMFKGLSTFDLELTELSSILKRNGPNTLVIADEIAHGTEHLSQQIITLSTVIRLAETKTSFITATHLHEIVGTSWLNSLDNVKCYHLHVSYDEKTNTLIYDRQLTYGSGENFYGLHIAKYVINDENFMNLANNIKSKISDEKLISEKTSNYNNNIYMTKCMICGKIPLKYEIPLETHHIEFQSNCDDDGFSKNKPHIKKNDKANLCVLCHDCHLMIDKPINGKQLKIYGYKDTSEGIKLDYKIIKYDTEHLFSHTKKDKQKNIKKTMIKKKVV